MKKLSEKQKLVLEKLEKPGRWSAGFGSRISACYYTHDSDLLDNRTVNALIERGLVKVKKENPFARNGILVKTSLAC